MSKIGVASKTDGQVLVLVAILVLVLLLFVAAAVDVGHLYQRRRQMQNAADAAALAGAHTICFGPSGRTVAQMHLDAEDEAEVYATANGAHQVAVTFPVTWTVNVTATETTPTFFLGVLGMDWVDVGASAAAACGSAQSLCGIWPISFHVERWTRMDCWDQGDPAEKGVFYIFNDDTFEEDDPCFDTLEDPVTGDDVCYPACDVYDDFGNIVEEGACACNVIPPDNNAYVLGPGHRGWLMLPEPEPPYDDALNCTANCGSNQVRCWIENDAYSGELEIPASGEDFCLPGQTGVAENVRIEIERNHIGETPNILLWDRECGAGDPPAIGTCPGTPYHISGTGCVEILDVLEVDLMRREPFRPPDKCASNVKIIQARRLCDCTSACGSTAGGNPTPGGVKAVSLIK